MNADTRIAIIAEHRSFLAVLVAAFATVGVIVFGVVTQTRVEPPPVPRSSAYLPKPPPEPPAFEMEVPDPNAAFNSWKYVGDGEQLVEGSLDVLDIDTLERLQETRSVRIRSRRPEKRPVKDACLCIVPGDM